MNQTDCAHFQEILDDYRRQLLSDDETSAVAAHLESCEACREELQFRNELAKQLRATLPVANVRKYHLPPDLKQAIYEMSGNDQDRKHRSPLLPWMLAAAIVIIGVVGFYGMDNGAVNRLPSESRRQISMSATPDTQENRAPAVTPVQDRSLSMAYSLSNEPAEAKPERNVALDPEARFEAPLAATADMKSRTRKSAETPADAERLARQNYPAADIPMPAATPAPASEEQLALYAKVSQKPDSPVQDEIPAEPPSVAPAKASSSGVSAEAPAMAAIPAAAPLPAMKAPPPLKEAYYPIERKREKSAVADNANATVHTASRMETRPTGSLSASGQASRSVAFPLTTSTLTSTTLVTTSPLTEITTAGVALP